MEVRDGSGKPPEGPGRLIGPSGRSGKCRGTLDRSGTSRGTLPEVRKGSGESRGGPGQVERPSGRSGKDHGTLLEVQDRSVDLWGGLGHVGGPLGWSETCRKTLGKLRTNWWTHGEARYGLGDPRGGLGRVGVPSVRCGTDRRGPGQVRGPMGRSRIGRLPFWRFGMDRGTLGEVRDGPGDPPGGRDGSGDTRGGPRRFGAHSGSCGQIGGPSGRLGMGRGMLEAVRDESGDPPRC